jgi:outer membrane biogenesis lipoprotein LolB
MKRILIASASSLAFLALAACSDTDDTQTQSIDQQPLEQQQQMQQDDPAAAPPPAEEQMDAAPSE